VERDGVFTSCVPSEVKTSLKADKKSMGVKILDHIGTRTGAPGSPARSQSLYRLRYAGSQIEKYTKINFRDGLLNLEVDSTGSLEDIVRISLGFHASNNILSY
jgi:hypothetical protein